MVVASERVEEVVYKLIAEAQTQLHICVDDGILENLPVLVSLRRRALSGKEEVMLSIEVADEVLGLRPPTPLSRAKQLDGHGTRPTERRAQLPLKSVDTLLACGRYGIVRYDAEARRREDEVKLTEDRQKRIYADRHLKVLF